MPRPPKGHVLVTSGTTNSGDLVWDCIFRQWKHVDAVNEYVSEYHAIARLRLEPCPFCGKPAQMDSREGKVDARRFTVGCATEGCFGYHSYTDFQRREDAQRAWNKRSKKAAR